MFKFVIQGFFLKSISNDTNILQTLIKKCINSLTGIFLLRFYFQKLVYLSIQLFITFIDCWAIWNLISNI